MYNNSDGTVLTHFICLAKLKPCVATTVLYRRQNQDHSIEPPYYFCIVVNARLWCSTSFCMCNAVTRQWSPIRFQTLFRAELQWPQDWALQMSERNWRTAVLVHNTNLFLHDWLKRAALKEGFCAFCCRSVVMSRHVCSARDGSTWLIMCSKIAAICIGADLTCTLVGPGKGSCFEL